MDEIDGKILEIISNHPEGLSYRQIWNKLRDERGRHLIAFPTLLRRVDQLEKRGYLEIKRSEWKRGRSVKIRPKKESSILSLILKRINDLVSVYKEFCESYNPLESELSEREVILFGEVLIIALRNILSITYRSDLSDYAKELIAKKIGEAIVEIEKLSERVIFSKDLNYSLSAQVLENENPTELILDLIMLRNPISLFQTYPDILKLLEELSKIAQIITKSELDFNKWFNSRAIKIE